jgi:hypothetical protein
MENPILSLYLQAVSSKRPSKMFKYENRMVCCQGGHLPWWVSEPTQSCGEDFIFEFPEGNSTLRGAIPQNFQAKSYDMEMNLSGEWMTVCVTEPGKGCANKPIEYFLCMDTSKPYGIEMTLEELEDPKVGRNDILGSLLPFKNKSFI